MRGETLVGKGTPYANRLGEYAGAAIMDMTRYRNALYEIEMTALYEPSLDKAVEEIAHIAREALRYYDPNQTGGAG